jgi:MerR family transcriptional regulator, light-induced transcriptional regulator
MNLKQAAAVLGVHYMTAYRYVRTGRLKARRTGTAWVVSGDDLASFVQLPAEGPSLDRHEPAPSVDWRARLRPALARGDEPAAWRVLEQALVAGQSPVECYLDVLVAAIDDISGRSDPPSRPVAQEYLATATATRLVARLGARFRRPGRSRGTVVFGAPLGEHHTLAIAVVADLVRLEGYTCLELGADVPPEAFAGAAAEASRLVAVGIGVSRATNFDAVRRTVEAVRAFDAGVPVIIGGQAAADLAATGIARADAWAVDGRRAAAIINELARSRRKLWPLDDQAVGLAPPPWAV